MASHILVVDDEQDLSQMMTELLIGAGFDARTADSGHDALAQIQADPPDLVLLDVDMPELDGFEVAAMLKSDPATATIPIIMVSAHDGRGARLIGLESGAEDYLSKPFDPAELLAKIRNLLLLQQRTLLGARH
ncbi:MAG: response regulator [Pseudomonadota bacterium]|nr:response regulator [Pseudomonadota bacterium]MDQ3160939.1 response regulator [Pseudomonadota bacterium]